MNPTPTLNNIPTNNCPTSNYPKTGCMTQGQKGQQLMSQTTRHGEPVTSTPGRPGRTPPGHHWVKTLVPASLHHRLRAYAGLSEMTLPAFTLATLSNAVPLAAPTSPQGSPPGPEGGYNPGLAWGPRRGPGDPLEPPATPSPKPSSGTPPAQETGSLASKPLPPDAGPSPAHPLASDPLSPEGGPHA